MRELVVDLGERSYPILIGPNLLSASDIFSRYLNGQEVFIVTNSTIEPLYLETVIKGLDGYRLASISLPDGESFKSLESMNMIITRLVEEKFSRACCLIALGGGVIGDITGFAAACYQRGVKYIQVPTTLLAQVDSSVGGKTAVNHPSGKNMIGAFHQPHAVLADTNVLATLPEREFRAGLAEIIKYGLIRDAEFFIWLEDNIESLISREGEPLEYAIQRSCMNKAEIVSQDERESGIRAILNFGHTFGHAIETGLNYQEWLHGEAVAVGMLMAAEMSCRLGKIDHDDVERIRKLLVRVSLPIEPPGQLPGSDIREIMSIDKKSKDGQLFLVLLERIGTAYVTNNFAEGVLLETINSFTSGN